MAYQFQSSQLANGKKGIFPAQHLSFNLNNADELASVQKDSLVKHQQIIKLLSINQEVFDGSKNLMWENIVTVADNAGISLDKKILSALYSDHNFESLSIDNYLRYQADEQNSAVCRGLADAISVYIKLVFRHHIERSLTCEEFNFAQECFLSGASLLVSNYEGLIRAGHRTVGEAVRQNQLDAEERKRYAFKRRDEYREKNPKASDAWIAERVAKELSTPERTVSKKTIQNYYSNQNLYTQ
ncbi:hypothetical protein BCS96_17165 [Vibrio breoganii]|uniref:hypothetical protein n=2 Tax=Vibrio breoganii TaxID=553239 RepID=UPI000C81C638|nr:hypothetical protein [Vibrio breoganii]PMI13713.1 hypothetical protein BCU49_16925 [Vibrio breoganii]PML18409.1 hypothetical protein BCT84_20080 [Vibrio breoganii]PML34851.1 hypothetical protein BCT78_13070 [Vibrio breoganii]PML36186.1 hypothetical protein BCT77_17325 [Vibrio breoganii]PMM85821.1 hypothetical protein BCT45_07490 [Vibrio breoganii]